MISYFDIKKILFGFLAVVILGTANPANAVKVQIFKPVDPQKEVSPRVFRDEAVSQAFAQALFSEAMRMIPGSLSPERSEALKEAFGQRYEEYIAGYKDMDVKQSEDGVSVRIDVNVNRKSLRDALKKMGMFVSAGQMIPSNILVSNEKYSLNDEQQAEQNEKINSLIALYAIQNATVSGDVEKVVEFSVRHASKKRWNGEFKSTHGKWFASGTSMEKVWRNLWERYYGSQDTQALMNPKAVLVVNGWFNPEGVREFARKLKSWDSAVQEVQLLDVEMKPTAVSASWSLEVSDQWVLRSYLNDYLPPRGLTFNLKGLTEEKE